MGHNLTLSFPAPEAMEKGSLVHSQSPSAREKAEDRRRGTQLLLVLRRSTWCAHSTCMTGSVLVFQPWGKSVPRNRSNTEGVTLELNDTACEWARGLEGRGRQAVRPLGASMAVSGPTQPHPSTVCSTVASEPEPGLPQSARGAEEAAARRQGTGTCVA
ncbi:hypothetical protein HJG60_011853 [Phyllostomus discolor]|uniref:Uncharacterized protein n=1 Tax=Phyllostomus discolor TaxID=89673 RepID=A0A833ZIR6_9CHIR|nr:hypothetical protein HJG60_011853 [Phyllostomus discolor]